ncbi:MAG: hypothetical protein ACXWXY_00875, partial [Aeromicrobium sp.]
ARSDELAVQSLNDFTDQALSGSKSLFSDYTDAGNEKSVNKVNSFATESSKTLSALSGKLSPDAESVFREAASTVTDLAAQAKSLCAECQAAELKSLADTVSAMVRAEGDATSGTDKKAPSVGTATSVPGGIDGQPPTFPGAAPPVPTPQELSKVTEPIDGALPGDDDQSGLVPRIVNGTDVSK